MYRYIDPESHRWDELRVGVMNESCHKEYNIQYLPILQQTAVRSICITCSEVAVNDCQSCSLCLLHICRAHYSFHNQQYKSHYFLTGIIYIHVYPQRT